MERNKATTAAEAHVPYSKQSDSGRSCSLALATKILSADLNTKVSTMTGTFDDLVQEPTLPGGLR
ncbi:BQ5605_C005g03350 [Microbotryum silenes-dioicae]|uniref:BQ5605_C005g03350 protein n=1 Tax=Microbotryum silenes-dioicae TaxID=796604 RepID=A0A2X0MF33_9BASI|nr:BQ5605_C005g03350 [Microbotryum silenes-dioicae]